MVIAIFLFSLASPRWKDVNAKGCGNAGHKHLIMGGGGCNYKTLDGITEA